LLCATIKYAKTTTCGLNIKVILPKICTRVGDLYGHFRQGRILKVKLIASAAPAFLSKPFHVTRNEAKRHPLRLIIPRRLSIAHVTWPTIAATTADILCVCTKL
jgi:hypothetical protein